MPHCDTDGCDNPAPEWRPEGGPLVFCAECWMAYEDFVRDSRHEREAERPRLTLADEP